jgi:hypothetical protein
VIDQQPWISVYSNTVRGIDIILSLTIQSIHSLIVVVKLHFYIRENPSCECGAEKETIQHIVEECPLTKFQQGFSKLHLLTEDALNWLQQIKNI